MNIALKLTLAIGTISWGWLLILLINTRADIKKRNIVKVPKFLDVLMTCSLLEIIFNVLKLTTLF
jgi:hypothetical protein